MVAGRDAAGLCILREQETGRLCANACHPARKAVANFRGSNSAPAWSPDGKKLAVVLSLMGGSQIFLVNADGGGLQRISQSSGIDTEPSFSPDGRYIIFTSDRGGSPQIYRMAVTGSSIRHQRSGSLSKEVTMSVPITAGWQKLHLHPSQWRPIQCCHTGYRHAPGPIIDRFEIR